MTKNENQKFLDGNFFLDTKQYKKALECFSLLIKQDSSKAIYFINRGLSNYFLNNILESIIDFDKAITLDPKNSSIYYKKGNSQRDLQLYKDSIDSYSIAISLNKKLYKCICLQRII